MSDPYFYPGIHVLRNLPDIRDSAALEKFERLAVLERTEQGSPTGGFDLKHLQAIHRHLFQDVYEWAGELRTVQMSKGDCAFMPTRFIETGMADVHSRLQSKNYLKNLGRENFIREAATIIGDVNHIHPFREGNGRTQMQFLQQLAKTAGHPVDVQRIGPQKWIAASIAANRRDYDIMENVLNKSFTAGDRSREVRQLRLQERERRNDGGRGR